MINIRLIAVILSSLFRSQEEAVLLGIFSGGCAAKFSSVTFQYMFLTLTSESIPIFRHPNQTFRSKQSKSIPIFQPKAIPLGVANIYAAYTGGGDTLCPPGPLGFKCPYFKSNISPIDLFSERNREVGGRLW